MTNEPEAKFAGNALLEDLNVRIGKFDDPAAVNINEVIVMFARGFLIPAAPVPEVMTLQYALCSKEFDSPVDR